MDNLLTITVDYDKKEEVRLSLSFFYNTKKTASVVSAFH